MGVNYTLGTGLARVCFTAFARWEVEGREGVPPLGPLIVVSNHLSNADPAVLVTSLPRKLTFMAKRSLFANPLGSAFLTAVGAHPVSRGGVGVEALRWNLDCLKRDRAVVIFPEGTRSRGDGMGRGQAGVAYLAARSQAPILPVAITGTENIKGYWRIAFPLCRIGVRIGQPFTLPILEGKLSRPVLEGLADAIMQRIADLLPPQYKGYYSAQTAGRPG